jgi:hypothetical protein
MSNTEHKELIRVVELDYEKTTKLIEGIVGTSFTIRGWGIALISALIGFTFHTQYWQVAALALVVTLLIAFMDGYHSWLYAKTLQHTQNVERVLGLYYAALARGDDDPGARRDFEVAILAHQFGRFAEIQKQFGLKSLREARPRMILVTLYGTLLGCALVSGTLVFYSQRNPPAKFECTVVAGTKDVYVCRPK